MPTEPLTEAREDVAHLLVLLPHLEDAVLSCGALMDHARKRMPVTVVTFFAEASVPPYMISARSYPRQTGADDAERLYRARRAEDWAFLEGPAINRAEVHLFPRQQQSVEAPSQSRTISRGLAHGR